MATPVETAVATYIRVFREPDPTARAALIDACFAADGRFVTRSRVLRGRAAIAEMAARFFADPNVADLRVTAIDAQGTTFRFRAFTEMRDGSVAEVMDAGEIDADGRIAQILTFAGPF